MPIPFWAGHYIGLPFQEHGRSVAGLDCWGLARLILAEQFDVQVPSYTQCYQSSTDEKQLGPLVRRESLNWKVVMAQEAATGDVIVLRMRGQPMHVGMVMGDRQMLHIERGINSVLESYASLRWKNRVVGFFRHRHMINSPMQRIPS